VTIFLNTYVSSFPRRRAINPPSASMFQKFVTASKNVSSSSVQNYTSILLAGQGAYATQRPTAPPAPEPSTTPNTSPNDHHDRRTLVAIATSVGTIVGVSVLSLLGFILYCRHRRIRERRGADQFFRYKGRSLDLGKRWSFVPSRVIATAPKPPSLVAGDAEWRTHPFANVVLSTPTMSDDDSPISHNSLPVSWGVPDPGLKPETRRGERGKKTSSPAEVIIPRRALEISPPPHASAVPGPLPKKSPRRVPPPTLALDPAPTADHWQGPQMSGIPRRPATPHFVMTTDLPDPPPISTYTSTSTDDSSTLTWGPTQSGKHHRDPSLPPTTPTSGHNMASPKSIRTLPHPPPISSSTAMAASRAPWVRDTASTRGLEWADEKSVVDVGVQRPLGRRKNSNTPLGYQNLQFVPIDTGEAGITR